MKTNHPTQFRLAGFSILVLILLAGLSGCGEVVPPVQAAEASEMHKVWTTVGSAGTVDEASTAKIFFEGSTAQMGQVIAHPVPAAVQPQTESAVIRYNVTPVDGLFDPRSPCSVGTGNNCPGIKLELQYVASGANAHIIARLIEVDLASGSETERLIFDSKDFSRQPGYQVQHVGQCTPPALWTFDFEHKAYYIEATMTHSTIAASAAGIQMIKIAPMTCTG